MYQCPNCTANLKFDIPSQQLLCEHCETFMDPYAFEKQTDAMEHIVEQEEYEVTVFTCPQCGGELLCYDDTAATFCSYCGGSTILDSRISREKRPRYIIPFQKTREQCKEAYAKMIKKAFFLPKEMKDEDYISRFRSIYMPYWIYTFEKNEEISFKGVKHKVYDNIKITEVFSIKTEVEAEYKGLSFDASSAFSDTLSNAIAPFEWWGVKDFTPSYLSGFYADTGDVSPELYEEEAKEIARDDMCQRMRKDPVCERYEIGNSLEEAMTIHQSKVELAMLPVWFLSFRRNDRISYAVVNGQTGEVAGDLPIDKKSYMKWSFLWSVPLAVLLMFVMNVSAPVFLALTLFLAVICCVISCFQKREIRAKENYQDDKGKWYPVTPGKVWRVTFRLGQDVIMTITTILMLIVAGVISTGLTFLFPMVNPGIWMTLASFISIFVGLRTMLFWGDGTLTSKNNANLTWSDFWDTLKKTGVGIGLSLFIFLLHPKAPLVYYGAALFTMGLIVWDIMGIIDRHNLLVTREIPQFQKRGGEADGK